MGDFENRRTKGIRKMLFTRETDYALRLLRNLDAKEYKSISQIIDKELMTTAITYKVARKLDRGGLIESVRGNSGGYKLTRDMSEITLYDVFKIMNPDTVLNDCLHPDVNCPLDSEDAPCRFHKELCRIQKVLFEELQRKSLAEIMKEEAAEEHAE